MYIADIGPSSSKVTLMPVSTLIGLPLNLIVDKWILSSMARRNKSRACLWLAGILAGMGGSGDSRFCRWILSGTQNKRLILRVFYTLS